MEKKLQRIPHEGAVGGVCAGLGAYFDTDKTWFRVAFVVSVFFSGFFGIGLLGPVVYIILWIVLPVKTFSIPNDPFNVDYRATGQPMENIKIPSTSRSKDRYIAGLILLGLGVFFLLHQLDLFYWRDVARFWPILIIIMGLVTIFGAFNDNKRPSFPFEKEQDSEGIHVQPTAGEENGNTYTK